MKAQKGSVGPCSVCIGITLNSGLPRHFLFFRCGQTALFIGSIKYFLTSENLFLPESLRNKNMNLVESKTIKECRICGNKVLSPIFSLGDLYVSDFLKEGEEKNGTKAPLDLVLCGEGDGGCGLLQLKHTVSHEAMYRNYWYRSGISGMMQEELGDIVQKVKKIVPLRPGDSVIDIGSNDSTMLRLYNMQGLQTFGFEPATNLVEKYGREGVTKIMNDFFSFEAWEKELGSKKAQAITAIAMFYDLDDPNKFVADMAKCLDDNGLIVIQMLYLPSLLEKNAFDGICHEHLEYYSLASLERLLQKNGLEVVDVEFRPHVNEGSFRIYIRKVGGGISLSIPVDTQGRLSEIREKEKVLGLGSQEVYSRFADRVNDLKKRVTEFIHAEKEAGKTIYVYGASTKGNTLLQYFGLDSSVIEAAAERNPDKWGAKTVGTGIPIISEDQARANHPDYFLVLPWHFFPEFLKRESDFLAKGGKFIVPLPEFKVVGQEDL